MLATESAIRASADLDQRAINAIRFLAIDAVQKAGSGHPGAPMGLAPAAYTLWDRLLKHNPADPSWPDRDRFVLSAGHASMLLYSLLYLTGYDLPLEQLKQFRQWESQTPGHPEWGLTPGVEVTTGPLGQGFSNGVGMAIAERVLARRYNRPGLDIVDHHTYVICSDGDLEEGVSSEAASLAGALGLGKLVYLYDHNGISIDGDVSITFREDVGARFRAYGWHVVGPVDGLDTEALEAAIRAGQAEESRPTLVIVSTTIAHGSPNKAGTAAAHGEPLGDDEVRLTRESLGWDHEPFVVPDEVLDHTRLAVERGRAAQEEWTARMDEYRSRYADEAASFERDIRGGLADGWQRALDDVHAAYTEPVATRAAFGKALNAAASVAYTITGGSADLSGSNSSFMAGRGLFQAESPEGANVPFGVREHSMGAVANGMAVHGGLTPYTATFLIFSDYMRPAVRLAALSGYPTIFVYTHDSIALGEDGPTHQPISQLMGLRLIPNLTVIRPADAHETAEAWRAALARRDGPTVIVLTRQALPLLDAERSRGLSRGAYSVFESGEEPEIALLASGSEVHPTIEAGNMLADDGVAVRVISMPSWELFEAQPDEYRHSLLPPDLRVRLSVEAGTPIGWERYVGLDGDSVGMDGYGASAPGAVAYEKFGFTSQEIARRARALLERSG